MGNMPCLRCTTVTLPRALIPGMPSFDLATFDLKNVNFRQMNEEVTQMKTRTV